jgi:hypothetical protein
MRFAKILVVTSMVAGLLACGSAENATGRKTPAVADDGGDDSGSTGADKPKDAALLDYFRDDVDFTAAQLEAGASNCSYLTDKAGRLDELVIPWPDDLKNFMAAQLEANFPLAGKLDTFLHGLYLVKDETFLDESGDDLGIGGLTCDRGEDNKGLLFLSESVFVTQRLEEGLGTWQTLQAVQYDYLLLEVPDQAFFTLVHELFHAVDTKMFYRTTDQDALAKREESILLAWKDFDTPKWDAITMTTLRGVDVLGEYWAARKKYPLACRAKAARLPLGLQDYTANEIKTELSHLKNDTNFLVPYTMANAAEDFAETLAAYVVGSRTSKWDLRVVYDQPITDTLDGLTAIYTHDSGEIIRTSAPHREKMCFFAEMSLDEDCRVE